MGHASAGVHRSIATAVRSTSDMDVFAWAWPFAAGILGALLAGCTMLPPGVPGAAPQVIDRIGAQPDSAASLRTVVLVSIDGLAPWVVERAATPVLDTLVRQGTQASLAETIQPPRTLPSHTSMLSGLDPSEHGVYWNRWAPTKQLRVRTLFSRCLERSLRCGLFAGKKKFAHFARRERGVELYRYADDGDRVLDQARAYVLARRPAFVMVHLAEVDRAGHSWGWGSERQVEQITRIDAGLGRFWAELRDGLDGALTLLVTADHGGEGRTHYGTAERHVRIPWIAWGDGVPGGAEIPRVSIKDTAGTVAALMGLEDVALPGGSSALSRARVEPGRPRSGN